MVILLTEKEVYKMVGATQKQDTKPVDRVLNFIALTARENYNKRNNSVEITFKDIAKQCHVKQECFESKNVLKGICNLLIAKSLVDDADFNNDEKYFDIIVNN
jgi:hypothetical protein